MSMVPEKRLVNGRYRRARIDLLPSGGCVLSAHLATPDANEEKSSAPSTVTAGLAAWNMNGLPDAPEAGTEICSW